MDMASLIAILEGERKSLSAEIAGMKKPVIAALIIFLIALEVENAEALALSRKPGMKILLCIVLWK